MNLHIEAHEPLKLPAPWSDQYTINYRKRLKQLGISPYVDSQGLRVWRVCWRPFLEHPVAYRRADGSWDLKRKADKGRSKRFPIAAFGSEEEAFQQAAIEAAVAYRIPVARTMPIVDWGGLARAAGVKPRDRFMVASKNADQEEQALELFRQGYSPRQVGEQVGIDRSTASRWRKRFRKEKALP
jgi:hypothetical protein